MLVPRVYAKLFEIHTLLSTHMFIEWKEVYMIIGLQVDRDLLMRTKRARNCECECECFG